MSNFLGAGAFQYPPPKQEDCEFYGVYPVDFLFESVLRAGLEWFRTDPEAPKFVFGHLLSPYLSKYGQAKIDEITNYIKKYDIKIVQHWSLINTSVPCISIQLLDANEMTDRAGLSDFQRSIDALNTEMEVVGRRDVGYSPISDNIHIGIHTQDTPDLVKYIYYLVVYILNSFKSQFEAKGMMLGTFRATDLSRLNEYLPENMYSRYINFSIFTTASFDKGAVPIIEEFMGVHVASTPAGITPSDTLTDQFGVTICLKDKI